MVVVTKNRCENIKKKNNREALGFDEKAYGKNVVKRKIVCIKLTNYMKKESLFEGATFAAGASAAGGRVAIDSIDWH